MVTYRTYDPTKDHDACLRIWRECGWFQHGRDEDFDLFFGHGSDMVAELNGEAECAINTAPGTIRYLDEELPFSCITGVTTSRIARKRGLALSTLARALSADATQGALVSGLGIFEQGFYDQLGYGSGGYEHWISLDPAHLDVSAEARVPRRIGADDWQIAHAARLKRARGHGSCNLSPAATTRFEMARPGSSFGLGYFDGPGGELTHCFWCRPEGGEFGPHRVEWMVFRTGEQLLELIALLKTFGDQVRSIRLREPPGIQMQDLIDRPFRLRIARKGSKYECTNEAAAYWQMRVLDVPGCLARTHLPGAAAIRLNVSLTDPIERWLPDDASWRGVAGNYVVTFGPESAAEPGSDASLPTLSASVNAFTRLWLGVRPATSLAVTDDLCGPAELLAQLDDALRLPEPRPDWDF